MQLNAYTIEIAVMRLKKYILFVVFFYMYNVYSIFGYHNKFTLDIHVIFAIGVLLNVKDKNINFSFNSILSELLGVLVIE